MSYCLKCGERVNEGDEFCSKCGARLEGEPSDIEKAAVKTTEAKDYTMARLKLPKTLGIVTLAVSVIMLFALLITLDVEPGEYRLVGTDEVNTVNGLKVAIWFLALAGGGLLGYTKAVRLRSRPGASRTLAGQLVPSIGGGLLLAWSIERMACGVAPAAGLAAFWGYGPWYGFEAAVAAVLMNLSAFFGAFFLSRGLNS